MQQEAMKDFSSDPKQALKDYFENIVEMKRKKFVNNDGPDRNQ